MKFVDSVKAAKKAENETKAQVNSTPSPRVSPEAAQQQAKLLGGNQLPTVAPEAQAQATLFNPYQSFMPFAMNGTPSVNSALSQPRPSVSTASSGMTTSSDASSPAIQTPAQPTSTGALPMDTSALGTGMNLDSWMNMDMTGIPGLMSPGTQFLSYLNASTGDFSADSYLNFGAGEKQ